MRRLKASSFPGDTIIGSDLPVDLGVVVGLVVALGAIVGSNAIEGGSVASLINPAAMLLIFAGTTGVTAMSVGMSNFKRVPGLMGQAFKKGGKDPHRLVETIVAFAQKARREGLLALEEDIQKLDEPFLSKGLQMVVDGADPEMVETVLMTQVSLTEHQRNSGAAIFEAAGGYAPTMGIVGTVMGLIHVLGNLENPSELGPAISVAFLATFWGIALANVLFLPLASKLKVAAKEETEIREMTVEGILSIQKGDSPTVVKEKLQAFLSAHSQPKGAKAAPAVSPQAGEEHA